MKFFGDGDSNSFTSVENKYENIKVQKMECIGRPKVGWDTLT